ncbi:MAG: 6,7-dimethyl-8-ribityllumazine synthase [Limosilactobacillus sp.]|jgi:6,7-dimethyl-8-ribityllumazine synthase|uniref:6,7-dimethyl-8-ribityllumazine synthase n=1 Tax=Limosilactobacillus sp. TaxID=2773925 RepID=UPI0025C24210|nr:6,7-dimethyl-8-ribityllumazine synthase [Limosilactobacillus sp.]MCI1975243.1 6,7-dimethyl-8-ribityllumazine synthase [Limosilactobacillus sp.]MCI2030696.1 6,7-dimethyl-8-ribityllumazine synthase [Limosilactobacillus sp.]
MNEISGKFNQHNMKVAIVVADFNDTVTRQLKSGAVRTLSKFGLADDQISVYHVPGAFEIPFTVKKLLTSNKFDGIMTLGAVIKGETDHYDLICQNVTSAIMQLNLQGIIPITFGLLTTDNIEQAMQRAGLKMGNEGASTAQSLLEMISLNNQI